MPSQPVQLNLLALTPSQSEEGKYVAVLIEHKGSRRIPIIIGKCEAQAIAMGIEGVHTVPPQSHDLTIELLQKGGMMVFEVRITSYHVGEFQAELIIKKGREQEVQLARVSDALALAVRMPCPIFTHEEVMDKASVSVPLSQEEMEKMPRMLEGESPEKLEQLLAQALRQEDYERAEQIRRALQKSRE